MFQIGDSLREARTRRGLSPADVHKAIRIRERYLTALEEERWDMLPGEAYTKGFLRTYAEFLGLNGNLYIDEYNARIARHDDEPQSLVPHASVENRRVGQRSVLITLASIVVLGAAVAGLAAWQLGGSSTPPRQASAAAADGGRQRRRTGYAGSRHDDDGPDGSAEACLRVHLRGPRAQLGPRPAGRVDGRRPLRGHPRAGAGEAILGAVAALGADGPPRGPRHHGRRASGRRAAGLAV